MGWCMGNPENGLPHFQDPQLSALSSLPNPHRSVGRRRRQDFFSKPYHVRHVLGMCYELTSDRRPHGIHYFNPARTSRTGKPSAIRREGEITVRIQGPSISQAYRSFICGGPEIVKSYEYSIQNRELRSIWRQSESVHTAWHAPRFPVGQLQDLRICCIGSICKEGAILRP